MKPKTAYWWWTTTRACAASRNCNSRRPAIPLRTAASGDEALRRIEEDAPALVITDLKMPGISGLDLLKKIREQYPQTAVVMVTAFGTVQTAVAAMKAGAYDYITKPIDYEELLLVVNRAMEHQRTGRRGAQPARQPGPEVRI